MKKMQKGCFNSRQENQFLSTTKVKVISKPKKSFRQKLKIPLTKNCKCIKENGSTPHKSKSNFRQESVRSKEKNGWTSYKRRKRRKNCEKEVQLTDAKLMVKITYRECINMWLT